MEHVLLFYVTLTFCFKSVLPFIVILITLFIITVKANYIFQEFVDE